MSEKRFLPIILLLVSIFWLFTVFYGINTTFNFGYDEGVYLQTAYQHAKGQKLYQELFLSQPPLLVELLSLVIKITGNGIVIPRLVPIFFSAAVLSTMCLIANELFGRKTGAIASILLCINFYFIKWTKVLNANIPSLTFALLAIFAA